MMYDIILFETSIVFGARKRRLRLDGRLKRRKNSVFKISGYVWTGTLYDTILKMKRFHEIN